MKRTIYVCPGESCTFLSMTPGKCRSHPYPLRAMGPELAPLEVVSIDELCERIRLELHSEPDGCTRLDGVLGEAITDEAGNCSLEFVTPEELALGICNWLKHFGPREDEGGEGAGPDDPPGDAEAQEGAKGSRAGICTDADDPAAPTQPSLSAEDRARLIRIADDPRWRLGLENANFLRHLASSPPEVSGESDDGGYVRSGLASEVIERLEAREAEASEALEKWKAEYPGRHDSPSALVSYTEKRIYRDAILILADTDYERHVFGRRQPSPPEPPEGTGERGDADLALILVCRCGTWEPVDPGEEREPGLIRVEENGEQVEHLAGCAQCGSTERTVWISVDASSPPEPQALDGEPRRWTIHRLGYRGGPLSPDSWHMGRVPREMPRRGTEEEIEVMPVSEHEATVERLEWERDEATNLAANRGDMWQEDREDLQKRANDLQARLGEAQEERDLAIAHDRQPYPTADAYEKVCAARTKWQDRAEQAEAAIAEASAEFERRAEVYARKRAECKAAEDRDRASGKLAKAHSYEATWNYYEGLSRAYEADAQLLRKEQAALKGEASNG